MSVLGETPDLTVGVRVHDIGLVVVLVNNSDGSVTLANQDAAGVVDRDGADDISGTEFDDFLNLLGDNIDAADFAVLGARPNLAVGVSDSADELLVAVGLNGTLALALVVPVVDATVGATGPALASVVPSDAVEGAHVVA